MTCHQHGPQLHILGAGQKFVVGQVAPIEHRGYMNKPRYGLWTSTFNDGKSDWVRWCVDEQFGSLGSKDGPHHGVLLTPLPTARLLCIDTEAALIGATTAYALPMYAGQACLNFNRISEDYDGVHLTEEGQRATRYSSPHDLYGWDCESTVWFRWAFEDAVEEVTLNFSRVAVPA